jgi:hypothetical protein
MLLESIYSVPEKGYLCASITGGSTNNPRKRGREVATATGVSSSAPINPIYSLQSQASQLIDLSQLHNHHHHPPNVVSTGLRLSFGDQQQRQQLQQQQHQQQQQQQQQQQLQQQHVCQSSSAFLSLIAEDFASQIKHQRDEIEQFLQAQVFISPLLKLVSNSFFFFWYFKINFFSLWNWFIGRPTAAHISREKAEALSCAAGRSGGGGGPEIAREGGRGGEGRAQERRAGGTRDAT